MPPVDAFLRQSGAVLAHDATAALSAIDTPTLITFGEHDMVTSTRFAGPAPIYEITDEFNQRMLQFQQRHSGSK
jgi:pimeloyl-ACP methyl ester carboxylesterase